MSVSTERDFLSAISLDGDSLTVKLNLAPEEYNRKQQQSEKSMYKISTLK